MRVSLVQTSLWWEEKEKNLIKSEQIIQSQAKKGVDLILFPEMSFTGFSMNTDLTGEQDEYTLRVMSEVAKANSINIGFGWVEKTDLKSKNRYTVVNRNGDVVFSYSKIHPFSYAGEDKKFVRGNEIAVFLLDEINLSGFICYDLRFPELFRAVADDVHAIIIPACWPAKRAEHWNTLLKARAIENQLYIFAVNCVGDIGGVHYSGDSCVINPEGEIEKKLSHKSGVLTYDFTDDVSDYRKRFPVLNDRIDYDYRLLRADHTVKQLAN